MEWITILISTFSGAGLTALVTFKYCKDLLDKAIDSALKKGELKYADELNRKLLDIQDQLSRLAKRDEIQFSKLQEKRVEAMITVSSSIVEFEDAMDPYIQIRMHLANSLGDTDGLRASVQLHETLKEAGRKLTLLIAKNRMLFPLDVANKLTGLGVFQVFLLVYATHSTFTLSREQVLKEVEQMRTLRNDLNETKMEIEDAFRRMLGDNGQHATSAEVPEN